MVDDGLVWKTITEHLPRLQAALASLLAQPNYGNRYCVPRVPQKDRVFDAAGRCVVDD